MAQARFYANTASEMNLMSAIDTDDTSISVDSASGLPSDTPFTLILDFDTASEEIVTVTAVSGTTLTISRGNDGTTAVSHDAGAKAIHAHTARDFNEPQVHLGASADVHGIGAGNDVVGTGATQVLTNKDLTSGTNDLPTDLVRTTATQTLTNKTVTNGTYLLGTLSQHPLVVCTSSTRPAHTAGRMIYETNTTAIYISDGAVWNFLQFTKMCFGELIKNSAQAIPNNSVTAITWVASGEDVGGITDGANNQFVVPSGRGGFYSITVNGEFAAGTQSVRSLNIQRNGTPIAGDGGRLVAASIPPKLTTSITLRLAVGDEVTFTAYQNNDSPLNFNADVARATIYGPILP